MCRQYAPPGRVALRLALERAAVATQTLPAMKAALAVAVAAKGGMTVAAVRRQLMVPVRGTAHQLLRGDWTVAVALGRAICARRNGLTAGLLLGHLGRPRQRLQQAIGTLRYGVG